MYLIKLYQPLGYYRYFFLNTFKWRLFLKRKPEIIYI